MPPISDAKETDGSLALSDRKVSLRARKAIEIPHQPLLVFKTKWSNDQVSNKSTIMERSVFNMKTMGRVWKRHQMRVVAKGKPMKDNGQESGAKRAQMGQGEDELPQKIALCTTSQN